MRIIIIDIVPHALFRYACAVGLRAACMPQHIGGVRRYDCNHGHGASVRTKAYTKRTIISIPHKAAIMIVIILLIIIHTRQPKKIMQTNYEHRPGRGRGATQRISGRSSAFVC